ncbi:hypothetical protein APHAL10511_002146 [Amanita phalloides]|nr:hypothetical protein APHAL10511_002146 [Amanita phalloides]
MATSVEPTKHSSGPDPSATRWGRTGDPGSAFDGIGKPVKARGSGRGRGGRRGVAKQSPDPGTNSVPSASAIRKSSSTSGTSQTTTSPPSPVIGRIEKASTSFPTVPSSPSTLTSPGSARPQNRRRRSNAKNNTSQSRQTSGAESRPTRQRPPELLPSQPILRNTTSPTRSVHAPNPPNTSSDVKSNIDALVERVRASAVANHRSGTPGSHIDWAGDDDDSLPDLDDWGIKSPVPVTGNVMISPILMDGLTPLPESTSLDQAQHQVDILVEESIQVHHSDAAQPPSDHDGQSVTKGVDDADRPAADRVFNEAKKSVDTQETQASDNLSKLVSLHPSLPPRPASPMQQNARQPNHARNASKRRMKSPRDGMVLSNNVTFSPAAKHATKNEDQAQGREHDREEPGLAASIHAPSAQDADRFTQSKPTGPQTSITNMTTYPTSKKPIHRSPVQPRTPSSHHAQSTTRVGMSHTRSQSSPSLAKNNGRASHRPVISGDAITKIAKTIGASASSSKSAPLSEVL